MVGLIPVGRTTKTITIIEAPTNLGLRPPKPGVEPGAWQAPDVLREAGLHDAIRPDEVRTLPRPIYRFERDPTSEFRNGSTIRAYTLELADEIGEAFDAGSFPIVIGGDCSVLLGGLLAARRRGRTGLLHIDGHSDFYHRGNRGSSNHPGSVAGMDLAVAIGLGQEILTRWDDSPAPLVEPQDVIQIGERESYESDFAFADAPSYGITVFAVQQILEHGVGTNWAAIEGRLDERGLDRVWMHIDVDVLDQAVMPAVDSPGSPGLDYEQLAELARLALESERIIGAEITIYDPDLDPDRRCASELVDLLAEIFAS
jgi:arginase